MGALRSFEEVFPPSWPMFLNLIHQSPYPVPQGQWVQYSLSISIQNLKA